MRAVKNAAERMQGKKSVDKIQEGCDEGNTLRFPAMKLRFVSQIGIVQKIILLIFNY